MSENRKIFSEALLSRILPYSKVVKGEWNEEHKATKLHPSLPTHFARVYIYYMYGVGNGDTRLRSHRHPPKLPIVPLHFRIVHPSLRPCGFHHIPQDLPFFHIGSRQNWQALPKNWQALPKNWQGLPVLPEGLQKTYGSTPRRHGMHHAIFPWRIHCSPLALHTLAAPKSGGGSGEKAENCVFALFSARLATFAARKLGGGSGEKAENCVFALFSARLALTLHGFSGSAAKFSYSCKKQNNIQHDFSTKSRHSIWQTRPLSGC